MTPAEYQQALEAERAEIADMVGSWWWPWWSPKESQEAMTPMANAILARTCNERGHLRGAETDQITGHERCRRCNAEINFPLGRVAGLPSGGLG